MNQFLVVLFISSIVLLGEFFLESPLIWLTLWFTLGMIIILLLGILAESKWRKYENVTLTEGEELADIIETLLDNTVSELDLEKFEDMLIEDEHENIREIVIDLPYTHPPTKPDQYCNEKGLEIMRQFIKNLRSQEV